MKLLLLLITVIFVSSLIKQDPSIFLKGRNNCPLKSSFFFGSKKVASLTLTNTNKLIQDVYITMEPNEYKQDIFQLPRANLLIAIDGLDGSVFPNNKIESLEIFDTNKEICVSTCSISNFATLLTGVGPSKHKIFGKKLVGKNGQTESAFSRQGTFHEEDNLFDLLKRKYQTPFFLSISTQEQFKKAALPLEYHQNNKEILLKGLHSKIERLSKLNIQYSYNKESKELIIQFDSKVTFNLNDPTDAFLLVEVLNYKRILKKQVKKNVHAGTPSFYTITMTSLQAVASKYGVKSAQYTTAVQMINTVSLSMVQSFSKWYSQRTTAQIVPLGGLEIKREVSIANLLVPLQDHFPYIYLRSEENKKDVCETLRAEVEKEFHISCLKNNYFKRKLLQFDLLQTVNNTITNTTVDPVLAIAEWQTALWVGIGMAFCFIVASWVVTTISTDDITQWIIVDMQEKTA